MLNRGSFWVASWERSLIIRVLGFATQSNSLLFKELIEEMVQQGFSEFIIDLRECQGMDSTFLGVLAGIVCRARENTEGYWPIKLINATEAHKKVLNSLGLLCVLKLKEGDTKLPPLSMKEISRENCDYKSKIHMIREAHEHLVQLNDHNKQQFQKFLELLSEELRESQSLL